MASESNPVMHRNVKWQAAAAIALSACLCLGVSVVPASAQEAAGESASAPASEKPARLMSDDLLAILEANARGDVRAAYQAALKRVERIDYVAHKIGQEDKGPELHNQAELKENVIGYELLDQYIGEPVSIKEARADLAKLPENDELHWLQARLARRVGDIASLEAHESALGFVSGWLVCGPFENERGNGFDKAYLGEDDKKLVLPDFEKSFDGKGGRSVGWRRVPVATRLGYLDLNAMMRPENEALAYAFTTIEAPEACDVNLAIASDEGTRLWVNGKEVLSQHVHRSASFDQNEVRVSLRKGTNAILAKVTEAEGEWGLRLRVRQSFIDNGLKLATPAELATWQSRIEAIAPLEAEAGPQFPEIRETTADLTSIPRGAFVSALFEMLRFPSERKDKVAHKLLRKLYDEGVKDRTDRESIHLRYFLALSSASTASAASGTDENFKRDMLLEVLKHDPNYVPALHRLAAHYNSTLKLPRKAIEYAQTALEVAPGHIQASIELATAYSALGMGQEFLRLARELVKAYPDSATLRLYFAWFTEQSSSRVEAESQYEAAYALDVTNRMVRDHLLSKSLKTNDLQRYESVFQQGMTVNPFDIGLIRARAAALAATGQEQSALAVLERGLELAPMDDSLLSDAATLATRAANTLERANMYSGVTEYEGRSWEVVAIEFRKQAREWLDRAIEANPTRSDLKRYVEFLSSEAPEWEAALQQDISERIASALKATHSTQNPAHWVYFDRIVDVAPDGTAAYYNHAAVKVTSDKGRAAMQAFAAIGFGDVKVVSATIHKPDGTTSQPQVQAWGTVNPTIAVGDVLEARWRSFDTDKGFFGDYFGDIFVLEAPLLIDFSGRRAQQVRGLPADHVRVVYVTPIDRDLTYHGANGVAEPTVEERGNRRIRSYQRSEIPRYEDEFASPPTRQLFPTVYASTYKDWQSFGAWYYNLIQRQMKMTPAITAKVAELTAGLTEDREKIEAIYKFIVQDIRYKTGWEGSFNVHAYQPYEVGTIFDRCVGDCKDTAILMATMLNSIGIEAYPVLINSEIQRGIEDFTVAGPLHFNHAICWVNDGSEDGIYLDGTETYRGYGEMPDRDAGARVCIIKPEGGDMRTTPMTSAAENTFGITSTVTLDASGDAAMVYRLTPTSGKKADIRGLFENEGQRKQLAQRMLGRSINVTVNEVRASNLSDLGPEVWVEAEGKAAGLAKFEGGAARLKAITGSLIPLDAVARDWVALETRVNDMALPPPFGETLSVAVKLPAGVTMEETPESVAISAFGLEYTLDVTMTDDGFRIDRNWSITSNRIPADRYPEFREALQKAAKAEATTLALKKTE